MDAETFLAQYDPKMRDLAIRTREMITSAIPGVAESVSEGYAQIQYGSSNRLTDCFAYIAVYKDHVNLGFIQGTSLPDPLTLLEGTGKTLRHVKLFDEAQLKKQTASLRALLKAADTEKKAGK